MSKDDPMVRLQVGERVIEIDLSDISGLEHRDFRAQVGMSFDRAAHELSRLEWVAALIWLHDRRADPALTYDDTLASVTLGSVQDAEDKEPTDPPA